MLARHCLTFVYCMLLSGCAASAPKQVENQAPLPSPGAGGTYTLELPDTGNHAVRKRRLAVGPAEPVQCKFSPHFALGSAEPLPQDRLDLKVLADCLNSEGAREMPIEIIGHADVRGSARNNEMLGRARAERVRGILASHGVDPTRMQVRSVGEVASLGFLSGYSHGFDRRVDVALVYNCREPSDTNRYDVAAWK
jgi:outer membrane protein OmpA-like peptidoglycan-associated protein